MKSKEENTPDHLLCKQESLCRNKQKEEVYLLEVQCNSHIMIFNSILDTRALPPSVLAINCICYRMSFCQNSRNTEIYFKFIRRFKCF